MDGPQLKALAERLNDALAGQCVERIDVPKHRWQANVLLMNCAGQVIQRVYSRGKWLFFDYSHGVTWLCHLLTRAAWKIYPPQTCDAPSRLHFLPKASKGLNPSAQLPSTSLLTLLLRDGSSVALSGRPLFQIVQTATLDSHKELRAMGPDPLDPKFSRDTFQFRLRQCVSNGNKSIAAAILDQTILAGLSNPLKCEVLFTAGLSPATKVSQLYASEIDRVTDLIVALCHRAYRHHAGVDRQARLHQVYDRAGEPCMICGSEITVDRSASDAHWTWHCPTCQECHREPTLFDV